MAFRPVQQPQPAVVIAVATEPPQAIPSTNQELMNHLFSLIRDADDRLKFMEASQM